MNKQNLLYESIMKNVQNEIKKVLNESIGKYQFLCVYYEDINGASNKKYIKVINIPDNEKVSITNYTTAYCPTLNYILRHNLIDDISINAPFTIKYANDHSELDDEDIITLDYTEVSSSFKQRYGLAILIEA